ncbi:ABC transporter permease [Serratia rubidaea]|uniref:ABC transporter permease n=1 Tax=Serratia rubidaea TaxID=61652 RepID=UPI001782A530|nr:ABC transporter permease [Serratia rubidaea]MBD8451359.1 ABC transporter permease [Serratia rubidaea]MBS0972391.1 ABC transporter permease [Serratia rubidaea]MDC6111564.1 ABC transporter permease [Serratia rubidaea]UJD79575.1 hypothetical protein FS596_07625 [Serratia rubidaea]UJD84131.1 hypothetical protein FS595_07625 [Serratia rubidaea]
MASRILQFTVNSQAFYGNVLLVEYGGILSTYRQKIFLLSNLVNVELKLRHKKSVLGNLWYIVTPMVYAGLYYFAFSYVFSARSGQEDNLTNMVLLFWGVSLHAYLAEIMNKSTSLISNNINYVKKIIFPLELLCFRDVITGLVPLAIALTISMIVFIFADIQIGSAALALLTVIPYVLICLGFSLFFAALGVFVKDLSALCGMLTTVILFVSPVLYNLKQLPDDLAFFFYINPLTYPMQTLRELVQGKLSYSDFFIGYASYSFVAVLFASIAYCIFSKMKKHFVDVL